MSDHVPPPRLLPTGKAADDSRCPYCGKQNDGYAGLSTPIPKEGDISICFYCVEPAAFVLREGVLYVRKLTDEERAEVLADPKIRQYRFKLKLWHKGPERAAGREGLN